METVERKTERKAVICAVWKRDTKEMATIRLEPLTGLLYCDLCDSLVCNHVRYAMSLEDVRNKQKEAIRRTCSECLEYNSEAASNCNRCGSKLEA